MFARQLRKVSDMRNILIVNFMCLLVNLFFVVMQLKQGFWPIESYFEPVLTGKDKHNMMLTLQTMVKTLDAANITYFMYGGTLIGSYRHHGFVPWDDDVDLILNGSEKYRIRNVLRGLGPDYGLYVYNEKDVNQPAQWKFYLNSLDRFMHMPFKWPYIDIFFFAENETHIWDDVPRFAQDYCFPKSKVLPLRKRPFEQMLLNAPCDSHTVLAKNYDVDLCRSRQFSHMMELPMFSFKTRDVPCTRLERTFPFVSRTYTDGIMNETLKLGDYTLQTRVLPTHCGRRHV